MFIKAFASGGSGSRGTPAHNTLGANRGRVATSSPTQRGSNGVSVDAQGYTTINGSRYTQISGGANTRGSKGWRARLVDGSWVNLSSSQYNAIMKSRGFSAFVGRDNRLD